MGSCFARNVARKPDQSGYTAYHMEITEYINTTFANKVFVDWLSSAEIDRCLRDRIVELLPAQMEQGKHPRSHQERGVFVLTLGVAQPSLTGNR